MNTCKSLITLCRKTINYQHHQAVFVPTIWINTQLNHVYEIAFLKKLGEESYNPLGYQVRFIRDDTYPYNKLAIHHE